MSKEKQISELANAMVNECGDAPCLKCMWCDQVTFAHAEALYNAGYRKQSEWISVDERLPECEVGAESKAVLFITSTGFMYTGYYGCCGIYHDRYFRRYHDAYEGYDISSVTHWMPLPEAPKMEGGAE